MKMSRPSLPVATMLALSMLSLLGASSSDAAPHSDHSSKNVSHHTPAVAKGTVLLATGPLDADNSTVKAITKDNHFTWVRMVANTVITQGGKPVSPDTIVEGDKLLCLGTWVDDAWGPIFQARRIELVGNVGDVNLQNRVAAACQAVQGSSTPASGDNTSPTEASNDDSTNAEVTEQDRQSRRNVVVRAFAEVTRLSDAADRNAALQHNTQAIKAMKNAVAKYDLALDWADSFTTAAPEIEGLDESNRRDMVDAFRASDNYDRLADQQMKLWANLCLEYFGRNTQHSFALEAQAIQKSDKLEDAAHNALEKERLALQHQREVLGSE